MSHAKPPRKEVAAFGVQLHTLGNLLRGVPWENLLHYLLPWEIGRLLLVNRDVSLDAFSAIFAGCGGENKFWARILYEYFGLDPGVLQTGVPVVVPRPFRREYQGTPWSFLANQEVFVPLSEAEDEVAPAKRAVASICLTLKTLGLICLARQLGSTKMVYGILMRCALAKERLRDKLNPRVNVAGIKAYKLFCSEVAVCMRFDDFASFVNVCAYQNMKRQPSNQEILSREWLRAGELFPYPLCGGELAKLKEEEEEYQCFDPKVMLALYCFHMYFLNHCEFGGVFPPCERNEQGNETAFYLRQIAVGSTCAYDEGDARYLDDKFLMTPDFSVLITRHARYSQNIFANGGHLHNSLDDTSGMYMNREGRLYFNIRGEVSPCMPGLQAEGNDHSFDLIDWIDILSQHVETGTFLCPDGIFLCPDEPQDRAESMSHELIYPLNHSSVSLVPDTPHSGAAFVVTEARGIRCTVGVARHNPSQTDFARWAYTVKLMMIPEGEPGYMSEDQRGFSEAILCTRMWKIEFEGYPAQTVHGPGVVGDFPGMLLLNGKPAFTLNSIPGQQFVGRSREPTDGPYQYTSQVSSPDSTSSTGWGSRGQMGGHFDLLVYKEPGGALAIPPYETFRLPVGPFPLRAIGDEAFTF